MAKTGFIHHIGTFLLLAATVLLIVTDITAPVVNNIGLLKVDTPLSDGSDQTKVSYGTFGWCILNDYSNSRDGSDFCSDKQVGYHPVDALKNITNAEFSEYAEHTTTVLSRVMILHPIATGLAFISFLLALGSGMLGSVLASLMAILTFLTTLCVLICDFVLFGIIKSNINNADAFEFTNEEGSSSQGESHAYFSVGMWTTLISAICSLIASVVVVLACCSKRLKKRRHDRKIAHDHESSVSPHAHTHKRRKWMFWKRNRV